MFCADYVLVWGENVNTINTIKTKPAAILVSSKDVGL
jgi:hypothetical protein